MAPKPWGKIVIILLMSAGIMGVFVWKHMDNLKYKTDYIAHIPSVLKPIYDIFGDATFLVIGAVATLMFAGVGLKAVMGKPSFDD